MVHFDTFWARVYNPLWHCRLPETIFGLPSFVVIVFSAIIVLGFLGSAESRQCDTHRDCLGDYINCCSGYCRRSCNLSCSRDEHCGSPGSIEEYCCKGKCISSSLICEKPPDEKENVLSGPLIAVVVIFSVILVVAVCCVMRSHLCKLRALCFGQNARQRDITDMTSKGRGAGFVSLGRGSVETEDGSNCTEGITMQSSTWVGQDFRIAPPKPANMKRSGRV